MNKTLVLALRVLAIALAAGVAFFAAASPSFDTANQAVYRGF